MASRSDLVGSLDLYAALGVPVERTLLGLPLYGMTWPVDGPGLSAPGHRPRRRRGSRGSTSRVRRATVGFAPTTTRSRAWSSTRRRPASDGGWDAVYFDSPETLTPKLALADERGLAGAGFWAVGYERGLPGYTELIATFRAGDVASVAGG